MSEGRNTASLVSELRALADCDARAGEPLGKCMRRAAAALESTTRALSEKEGELAEARELSASMQENDGEIAGAIERAGMTAGTWVVHALDQASAQWEHFAEAAESATHQRDEALAALKAARGALEPFANAVDLFHEMTDGSLVVGPVSADMPEPHYAYHFRLGDLRNARSALENGPAALADATNKDPGTEQREAGNADLS